MAGQVSELHAEWPDFKATVLRIEEETREHKRRIQDLEAWRVQKERRSGLLHVREHETYDADLTPAGGIRLPPEGWERLKTEFESFKAEAITSKARAEGANAALDGLKKNFVLWLGVVATLASGLVYVFTHFLKL